MYDVFETDRHLRDRFGDLRRAIIRLARTGIAERKSLRTGEQILPELMEYLRDKEELHKSAIRPDVAGAAAVVERNLPELLKLAFSQTPDKERCEEELSSAEATPNEIDAHQVEALKHYQWNRLARMALERIAAAVREINAELDRNPPEPKK